jgi:acyl carrier protein
MQDAPLSVEQRVKQVFAEVVNMPCPDKLVPQAELAADLGMDSLDMVEICMALEDEFDIEINDDAFNNRSTLKNIVDLVCAKI